MGLVGANTAAAAAAAAAASGVDGGDDMVDMGMGVVDIDGAAVAEGSVLGLMASSSSSSMSMMRGADPTAGRRTMTHTPGTYRRKSWGWLMLYNPGRSYLPVEGCTYVSSSKKVW